MGAVSADSTLLPPAARPFEPLPSLVLTVLYHPDVARIGERVIIAPEGAAISRTGPELAPVDGGTARAIGDRHVSRSPLHVRPILDAALLEAKAPLACLINGAPMTTPGKLSLGGEALHRGVVIELAGRVVLLLHAVKLKLPRARHGLVGDSEAIERVRADIDRVADLDVPVLLRGETGTGKELVARAIHASGPRAKRACVAVNVAAVPATTAASELFGHVKGAYTGATSDHDGVFVRADGGTLFLDEIGEIPFDVQPMLLRALETGEVTPLGGARTRKVDVRVIAATDADLETQVAESGFREALYHRLAGYQLFVPALRDRRDDIGRLFIHFFREELARTGDLARLDGQARAERLWLAASIVGRIVRHVWPGNVRQLRNAARQLAIANRGADEVVIDPALERLLAVTAPTPSSPTAAPPIPDRPRRDPATITDDELVAALRAHGWRAPAAAASLGVSRSKLYMMLDKSKTIRKAKDIPDTELRRALDEHRGDLDAVAAQLQVSQRALKLRLGELGLGE
jgi:two-component system, NtrC family, nitrogen regulation response regulator GlnG